MTMTPRTSTFEIAGPVNVHLRHVSGRVTVTTSGSPQCTVTLTAHTPEGQSLVDTATIEMSHRTEPAHLVVKVGNDGRSGNRSLLTLFWVFKVGIGKAMSNHDVDVHIEVPAGTSIDLKTVSGQVDCTGATLERAELTSVSGDLMCAVAQGPTQLKSTSGAIAIGAVHGPLDAKTVSGSVRTGPVHGAVDIKTVSGSVTTCIAAPAPVATKTVSGDIIINVVPDLAVSVDAKSVSGRLRSTIALADEEPTPRAVVVKGVAVAASTKSGTTQPPAVDGVVGINAQSVSGDILIQTLTNA